MKHRLRLVNVRIEEVRRLLADYIFSEGCSCCEDRDEHAKAQAELGKLLNVPKYSDGSGYNFFIFRSKVK